MYTVKFDYKEDEEYGGEGWIPQAFPNFNAAEGFGLVHDVLEHFQDDGDSMFAEMKAFGSMMNVRWLGGWGNGYHTPAQNMGSALGRFIDEILQGKELRAPPRTYALEEFAEEMLQDTLKEGYRSYRANYENDDDDDFVSDHDIKIITNKIAGWMRIGYRQSKRRFYNADSCELSYLFRSMEEKVKKHGGDYGQVLTVKVHPRRLEFDIDSTYPTYDD